jgi:hypothetical protein
MTSHATSRGTRTRVGEVVDDESPTSRATCRGTQTRIGEVVHDKLRDEPRHYEMHNIGEVVDDELHDEPRDVPRCPDAQRRRSSR